MKTVAMITMKKSFLLLIAGCTLSAATYAQEAVKDTVQVNKEKSNETNSRNVMLNASSANGPREISIGLPGGDVMSSKMVCLSSTIPILHNVNTHWRGGRQPGACRIIEDFGNGYHNRYCWICGKLSYATRDAKFRGKLNYNTNHFGKQQIDLNISGNAGKGWFYSGSIYQISTRELSSCVLLPIRTVPRFIKQPSPNAIIRTAVNYRLFIITAIAAALECRDQCPFYVCG